MTAVKEVPLYVNGKAEPAASDEYIDRLNPADGTLVTRVARAAVEDVDRAVAGAREGFLEWQRVTPRERGRVLYRMATALRADVDELASRETLENGKPLRQARGDVEAAARYFEFFAGIADKVNGETIPLDDDHLAYTRLEPYGVTAHIIPWNGPIQGAARGLAPALAGGNSVVAKPAEETSSTTYRLAEIAVESGMPPGVLNIVTGLGPEAGAALVAHRGIDRVTFTGSLATGIEVMRSAATRVLPVTLELGGKSPNIVFEDADLDSAANSAVTAITFNAGQVCSAGSRLLVHESIHDELVARIVAIEEKLTVGPGLDDPDMGPLTTTAQWHKVQDYLELARTEGVTVACGGGVPADLGSGQFISPTVLVDVDNGMRIAQEEIFGPVLSVIKFSSDDEALAIANDIPFGLAAAVWTNDLRRAHRVSAGIAAGQVFVNEYFGGGVETPFGGYKNSGVGREKGVEAIKHYLQTKTVIIRL